MSKLKENFKLFVDEILVSRWPILEQWTFLLFCFSLMFLSLAGFFFVLFITRGLHGYFLILHVAAGGIFAVTLTTLVILRANLFSSPDTWKQKKKGSRKRKNAASINRTQAAAAWIVVISGLFQVFSALVLMMPVFSTEVNLDITAWHRWSGLIALLAAVVYAYQSAAAFGREKQ